MPSIASAIGALATVANAHEELSEQELNLDDGLTPEGHQQVLAAGELVPAEEEKAHQCGLEEEGHQPLHRQRRAEDIADIVGVIGPVGPELELQGDPGGHPHHEVDAKQLAPEAGDVLVDHLAGHHVGRLGDHQDPGQPQGEGHKQKVEHRRRPELYSGEADHIIQAYHA